MEGSKCSVPDDDWLEILPAQYAVSANVLADKSHIQTNRAVHDPG
jgi:hypothetical protein